MALDENGVFIPQTIEQIKNDLKSELIAAGVDDLNIFDNSQYTQNLNPIVTKIFNLEVAIASFPNQIQKIISLQNLQIKRAGINTIDAILNLLLLDENIQKADVRNFSAGEITIFIYSKDFDLTTKNFDELTQQIVDVTSVFGIYVDLGGAILNSKNRKNSLEVTDVFYNIANEILVDKADPTNFLRIEYSSIFEIDESIENQKIENVLIEYFSSIKIGESLDTSKIVSLIFLIGNSKYKNVFVTFSGSQILENEILVYVSSEIVYV